MGTSNESRMQADQVKEQLQAAETDEQEKELLGGQDGRAFQRFYQENIAQIYRYIYNNVGNREDAEDLTSQTFMKAVRSIDRERAPQSMQKWLFQVARTTVADYWRMHYRIPASSLEALLDAGWEGPAEVEKHAEPNFTSAERVQHILRLLPDNYGEVLTCRFLLNLSVKETALRMGLTEANVKVLQFRALKRAADLNEGSTKGTLSKRNSQEKNDVR